MSHILFLAPSFFNYPDLIKQELEKRFDKVSYYKSVPATKLYKLSWYISKFLKWDKLKINLENQLFRSIIKDVKKKHLEIDCVFVIKGSSVKNFFYIWLKEVFPSANYIMYLWDDVCNDVESIRKIPYFDKVYSYNPEDCRKYNLLYRPFFYDESYVNKRIDKIIDISCFMSFSVDRIKILNYIFNKEVLQLNNFFVIKASWLLRWINRKELRYLHKYITYNGITYDEMMSVLQKSRCQLDIPHPKQAGLTTRAFEVLPTRTKLITTNQKIKDYDFYDPCNILVISRDAPQIDLSWINIPYNDYSETIMKKYSLSCFIDDVLNNIAG